MQESSPEENAATDFQISVPLSSVWLSGVSRSDYLSSGQWDICRASRILLQDSWLTHLALSSSALFLFCWWNEDEMVRAVAVLMDHEVTLEGRP